MLNFCDFIQDYVFSTNHHLNGVSHRGWILKEEEFEETNFVKISQLT